MREIRILVSDEHDDFDWIFEALGNVLHKWLPGDWYEIEEIEK